MSFPRGERLLATTEGIFFLVTGLWPLISLHSFMAVTGPKTDTWLVQTFGAVLAVLGAALLIGSRRGRFDRSWKIIAAGVPAALAISDVVFVCRREIWPIYLADAAVELLLVIGWTTCALRQQRGDGASHPE